MILEITKSENAELEPYKASQELLAAINTALFLQRPLLLSGDPGTGKTECANFVARQLNKLYPSTFNTSHVLRYNTKSSSQFVDLFYSYDAVAHFGNKDDKIEKESFMALNCLGIALLATHDIYDPWKKFRNYNKEVEKNKPPFSSVVLIDEIDKAPRDFPNDMLAELEKPPFKFTVKELVDFEVIQKPEMPVFVIITSNNEKGLPDAFLRRCVFHHIKFPDKEDLREIILRSNKAGNYDYINEAVDVFIELRRKSLAKKPSTSELIDWIACLQHKNVKPLPLANWRTADSLYKQKIRETLGVIAKSNSDHDILNQLLEV